MNRLQPARDAGALRYTAIVAIAGHLEHQLSSCVERIVRLPGRPALDEVARQCGCERAAIVGLHPCLVDGSFVAVLSACANGALAMQLLDDLGAATIAGLPAHTVLLGAVLAVQPPRVLVDPRILEHEEVVFCIEPPGSWGVCTPARLVEALTAELP